MDLYLFNPDADLALADGGANYIPPASARQMARDLALLPAWYAPSGSGVLAPSAYNDVFLAQMSSRWNRDVCLVTEPELGDVAVGRVVPWGWNRAVHRRLWRSGVPEEVLPAADNLSRWRTLASRERLAEALKAFRHLPFCLGESVNLHSVEACRAYVSARKRAVLKMPWSGSGKGLLWCRSGEGRALEGWCARVLRTQGCVVASPVYDKVLDFAMEFCMSGSGEVSFVGYSCFETNERGAYAGNLLLADPDLACCLARYVPCEWLCQVREVACGLLRKEFAGYVGCLGVDMMICRAGGEYVLHPCVEVNLRMNMGLVAGSLVRRLLAPGSWGHFVVDSFPSSTDLHSRHELDASQAPPVAQEGRLVSGYLPLVPVTPSARYRAFVRVHPPGTEHFRFHIGL